ncbi:Disease resistance protein RUN1 [Linum grandiflorum]
MASSSYENRISSSSDPPYSGKWEYDVFVCFRGEDTRDNITSQLAGRLREHGLRVFTDDRFERTEPIDNLFSIIAMSVVIFSKDFAESSYCLDEVATIAGIMRNLGHRVLPVFYKVKPENVSDDSGTYVSIIGTILKPNLEKKKRWIEALEAVAGCAGRTTDEVNDDYELCKTIVDDVLEKLTGLSSSGKFNDLVGMETRIIKVRELLARNDGTSNDTHVIGFWGMGGVGKTTLATTVYQMLTSPTNRIKHHFFASVKASEVEGQVRELYSTLLSENNLSLVDLNVDLRRERLSRLKVVVVLDNVETLQQLEKLLLGGIPDPIKLFGPGSVIIITSRDRGLLNHANARIFNVEGFDSSESLELFSLHAFRQHCPSDDLIDLSRRAILYCKGNPLAIKVLGGALFGKDKEYWKSFFCGLEKISKPEIHDVLSTSYCALKVEEQRLFMDVAFLSLTIAKTSLMSYLATRVEDLINKSLLVTVLSKDEGYELLVVHDLLKEMALNIVKEEPNPRRLTDPDDICKLFAVEESKKSRWKMFKTKAKYVHTKNALEGGKALEILDLDLSKVEKLCLGAEAFEGMNRLRFLSLFYYLSEEHKDSKISLLEDRLDSLPNELRWLRWTRFPLESLPEKFLPEKIVHISLRHSQIKCCWKGVQNLVHLTILDLSYCLNLRAVPNFSGCKELEFLHLKGCKSLVELPSSVQYLDKLVTLDLSDCSNLKRLPASLNSKFLERVDLSNCPKLALCPEINSSEGVLRELDLEETPLRELPSAVHKVKQGGLLRLCGKHITSFPRISKSLAFLRICHTMITKMDDCSSSEELLLLPRFDRLELVENSQLVSLPNRIWDMVKLGLWVSGSPLIESLPDILNHQTSVHTIFFRGIAIKSLPSSIHLLGKLAVLDLAYCESLESIPDNIHELTKLEMLSLVCCTKIQCLPQLLPPELKRIYLDGCKSLQALPSNIGKLNLSRLHIEHCPLLGYKLLDKIAADFYTRAMMCLTVEGGVLYCGSELPKWCSMNCEMELPPIAKLAKGIVFGVVVSTDGTSVWLKMKCDVVVEGTTVATFSSFSFGTDGEICWAHSVVTSLPCA